jgi:putative PIN family toxin of toxin-antitoxin system
MPPIEGLTRRDVLPQPVVEGPAALRVVIDTNAMLDWLVFAEPAALALGEAIAERRCVWCATPPMLDELRAVLARPLTERWEPARKLALTIQLDHLVTAAPTSSANRSANRLICRDAADQMFIDLALALAPSWLVTRDRALLALRRRAAMLRVAVATPEQWRQQQTLAAPT